MKSVREQRGAALIVGLLLLVIALILSLSSMQSSRLSERLSGNQRAMDRAYMAAEYGASAMAKVLLDSEVEGATFDDFIGSVTKLLNDEFGVAGSESGYFVVPGDDSAYFRYELDGANGAFDQDSSSLGLTLYTVGEVLSGGVGGEVVARRSIAFDISLDPGFPAAISMMCPVNFSMPSSPSGVDGEFDPAEVQGIRPAIAAGSLENAALVTAKIVGDASVTLESLSAGNVPSVIQGAGNADQGHNRAILVGNTYHASRAVVDADAGVVDYSLGNCSIPNNPMCGVFGGVSASAGAPVLGTAYTFHRFVDSLLSEDLRDYTSKDGDRLVIYHDINSATLDDVVDNKVNIFTSGRYHVFSPSDSELMGEAAGNPAVFDPVVPMIARDDGGNVESAHIDVSVAGSNIGNQLEPFDSGSLGGAGLTVVSGYDYFSSGLGGDDLLGNVFDGEGRYFPTDIPYLSSAGIIESDVLGVGELRIPVVSTDVVVDEGNGGQEVVNDIDHWDSYFLAGDVLLEDQQADFSSVGRPDMVDFGNSFGTAELRNVPDGEPVKGSTLIIVDGDVKVGTRPSIHGLVIVLGDYTGYGGGQKVRLL